MWEEYFTPASKLAALELLARVGHDTKVIAGGTDLILELQRRAASPLALIDISRVHGLDYIKLDEKGMIHLGALITHNQVVSSALCVEQAFPLVEACWSVGSPQIRNIATVGGNLLTASPANDTISALIALDASVTLESAHRGKRTIPLRQFYHGVRKTDIAPDELLTDIAFERLCPGERGIFLKLGLRRAMAVAVVNVAIVVAIEGGRVREARIALGSVGPTVLRASEAERFLQDRSLSDMTASRAGEMAAQAAMPISDIRGSKSYRQEMVGVLVRRALLKIQEGQERAGWSSQPAMLWGGTQGRFPRYEGESLCHNNGLGQAIETTINGQSHAIRGANDKTLLGLIREDLGGTGTKEGCGEGECGTCTVLLDGIAVLSCLVPAPRAHLAQITTVEGLSRGGELSNLQKAFLDRGAIQCGYCTPGFVMSGEALLREVPTPSRDTIRQALLGNLCRCTGYYKIIEAIEQAASCTSV